MLLTTNVPQKDPPVNDFLLFRKSIIYTDFLQLHKSFELSREWILTVSTYRGKNK